MAPLRLSAVVLAATFAVAGVWSPASANPATAPQPARAAHAAHAVAPAAAARAPAAHAELDFGGDTIPQSATLSASEKAAAAASSRHLSATPVAPLRPGARRMAGAPTPAADPTVATKSTIGQHHLVVVPVYWKTNNVPGGEPSTNRLRSSLEKVGQYYSSVSGGRINVEVDAVMDWRKVDAPGECDTKALWAAAAELAAPLNIVNDRFHHLVVYFPYTTKCGYSGLANVYQGYDATLNIALNGYLDPAVAIHEFGHNLGLRHSGALECTSRSQSVTLSDSCSSREYDDPWDPMGNAPYGTSSPGHLSGAYLDRIGLLNPADRVLIGGSRTFTLAPVESPSGARVAYLTSGADQFSIEYRTPTGLDAWLAAILGRHLPGTGVVVRKARTPGSAMYGSAGQDVLDFTPTNTADSWALNGATTWTAPDGSWKLSVISTDATGAQVSVTRAADNTDPALNARVYADDGHGSGSGTLRAVWDPPTDQSGIDRVEVALDGTIVGRYPYGSFLFDGGRGDVTFGPIPAGTHRLDVTAYDTYGNATTYSTRGVLDGMPPVIKSAPTAALAVGAVRNRAEVPVSLTWDVSDLTGLDQQTIARHPAGFSRTLGANDRKTAAWVRPGANTFSLTARDTTGLTQTAASASLHVAVSKIAGAQRSVTRKVAARSVGILASTGTGSVDILVDGRKVARVNLQSIPHAGARQIWAKSWPTVGRHTVKVVRVGVAKGASRGTGVSGIATLR